MKRGVSIACDSDLHLPPSLAGLSVASAINHCQVSFALVDGSSSKGSSSILYPCSFDSAASQVFHSTHTAHTQRKELCHTLTWVIGAACAFARQPKGASPETATAAAAAPAAALPQGAGAGEGAARAATQHELHNNNNNRKKLLIKLCAWREP